MESPVLYDVFLCYNRQDKDFVQNVRSALEDQGIVTWLDELNLPIGTSWYEFIFNHIGKFRSIAIFIGSSGIGQMQHHEIECTLREFVKIDKPVIPVLMPH